MTELSDKAATAIGRIALARARQVIPSRTLRRAATLTPVASAGNVSWTAVHIPHYWAVILHDGRKRVTARQGKVLVWFRNPLVDPRFRGRATPARLADRRRLTRSEFRFWLGKNRKIKDPNKRPMVVAKQSGPVEGDPFFGNAPGEGMHGLMQEAHSQVRQLILREIADQTQGISKRDARIATASALL